MILFDLATLTTLLRKGPAPMMGGGARAGGPLVCNKFSRAAAESGRWPPFCSVLASLCPSQLTAITLPPPLARDAPSSDGAEGASAQS